MPRWGSSRPSSTPTAWQAQYGQRPVIFCSNGYEHWLWDDARYPPRAVQGFYKKPELELMIQRRTSRKKLAEAVDQPGDCRAALPAPRGAPHWRSLRGGHQRKALVVMATGAGKTRTVIALADVLMRCNWAKRVLFLADRVALVNQAVNAFKAHLPDSSPVNLVTEKYTEGRVFVSTYPTMMGLIDDAFDGQRRFGVGHFDLIVIDEAHRSVYQKYRAIFEYFDALLVGLTATPKDEIDHNTYGLFDLETGVPTDAYGLDEAVAEGHLVPPLAVSVPLKFQREGIKYDDLSEAEKEQWDALEWNEEGTTPDSRWTPAALNKWLFNTDTVDKVLAHLMTKGQKVAGGDRLGKTIVFAKNNDHAEFIAERFNVNYPHYKGHFARVVTYKTEYAQSLIDDFCEGEDAAHRHFGGHAGHRHRRAGGGESGVLQDGALEDQVLADGGARHPPVQGPVRAGRGQAVLLPVRLLPEPGILQPEPRPGAEGSAGGALGTRLFKARLEMIAELDASVTAGTLAEPARPVWAHLGRRAVAHRDCCPSAPACGGHETGQLCGPAAARLVEKYAQA
jgi:type I restriction enzyme R subunit